MIAVFLAKKLSFQLIDKFTEFFGETFLDCKERNMIIEPSAERLILQKLLQKDKASFCRNISKSPNLIQTYAIIENSVQKINVNRISGETFLLSKERFKIIKTSAWSLR